MIKIIESSRSEGFCKPHVLEKITKFSEKQLRKRSFLVKLKAACNFTKKDTIAISSCEFCKILKRSFRT